MSDQTLTVNTASGLVQVQLQQPMRIGTLVQSNRDRLADGSFLGITSMTDPDGSQRAVEVHVFPESMRGSGEGTYSWDLPALHGGTSRMTNGTASRSRMTNGTVTAHGGASTLTPPNDRLNEARAEAEVGNVLEARRLAAQALNRSPSRDRQLMLALVLARAGEVEQAQQLADSLDAAFPMHTSIQYYCLPTIRAAM
jgi:hypothetical protein